MTAVWVGYGALALAFLYLAARLVSAAYFTSKRLHEQKEKWNGKR